ncbi:hypothetical protein OS493_038514 [Desmophyllum pertusum]|uniref:Uncharacterized protein n=1 Tax=Desmophyllum pertusum TaxID=174260 RepID=A0A9X0D049_9CNID|nr:hypothetical protein OS493_038514 [Desmophyllum pertusum]
MGKLSLYFVAILVGFGLFNGGGGDWDKLVTFPGLCQPFQENQTALCSELQTLVQDYGEKKICNTSSASCDPDAQFPPYRPNRNDSDWGLCYCDQLCKEIGDCCVDYDIWNKPDATNSKTKPVIRSCRKTPSFNSKQILQGYIMIGSCPSSWKNAETAHACMSTNYSADPVVGVPVLDMTTNVTYANIYCAMCHGKSRDLHLWSIRIVRWRGQVPTLKDIGSTHVPWDVVPVGEVIPEKCLVTPSEASTEPDTKIKQLCRSYANVIDAKDVEESKNPHCGLLTNPNVLINRTFRCYRSPRLPPRLPSMLFVFSIHAKTVMHGSRIVHVESNCTFNEVYDPFQGRCLPVHSGPSNSNNTNTTYQCQGPRFPSHEFFIFSNNSVLIIPHGKLYNNDSYILVNKTMIMCSNISCNYTSRNYTRSNYPKK